jgi:very-short-patch-repair endonuclease
MPATDGNSSHPFSAADGYRQGIARSELLGSHFRRVMHGLYVHANAPDGPTVRTAAALTAHPDGAYASHFSAARVWQLPIPSDPGEDISVSHANQRRRRAQVRAHLAPANPRIAIVDGLRVSAPGQLFAELAPLIPLVDLVALGDAAVRRNLISLEELEAAGGSAARRAARYVRVGVDSPMESRLRMLVLLAGLPEPQVNVRLRNEHGAVLAQFDLAYDDLKLALQHDGRFHDGDVQRDRDLHRREFLDHLGWRLVIVNSRGIYREPKLTLDRVAQALRDRGARNVRRRYADGWRQHFPSSD